MNSKQPPNWSARNIFRELLSHLNRLLGNVLRELPKPPNWSVRNVLRELLSHRTLVDWGTYFVNSCRISHRLIKEHSLWTLNNLQTDWQINFFANSCCIIKNESSYQMPKIKPSLTNELVLATINFEILLSYHRITISINRALYHFVKSSINPYAMRLISCEKKVQRMNR